MKMHPSPMMMPHIIQAFAGFLIIINHQVIDFWSLKEDILENNKEKLKRNEDPKPIFSTEGLSP